MEKVSTILGVILIISYSLISCTSPISSKEEALKVLKNSEWEEIHDTKGLGLGFDETSTYMYFDAEGYCYIYPDKGGYNKVSKSEALTYEVKFTKAKHNIIQICVNGCNNANSYYLDSENRDKIVFVGFGRFETVTRNLRRVK